MQRNPLTLCSLLLFACGGQNAVDLGSNGDTSGWANTQALATTSTSKAAQTLYDGGEYVIAIDVNETSIAAVIQSVDSSATRIDTCSLNDCSHTVETVYELPASDGIGWGNERPGAIDYVALSRGEIFWAARKKDTAGYYDLMSCPFDGCKRATRILAQDATIGSIVVGTQYIYWAAHEDWNWHIARCPKDSCNNPEVIAVPQAELPTTQAASQQLHLELDEGSGQLFLSNDEAIASLPMDFSEPPKPFLIDPLGAKGLAVAGGYVYFAHSLLTGEIRRCSVEGCDPGSELVVSAPRWPWYLAADPRSVIWAHHMPAAVTDKICEGALSSYEFSDETGEAHIIDSFGELGCAPNSCLPALNSHYLFWCEAGEPTMPNAFSTIRMLKR